MAKQLYYTVYDWMVQRLQGGAERDVYALLYSLAGGTGKSARVGVKYIAERTGYGERAIMIAIQRLTACGMVTKSRDNSIGCNVYVIAGAKSAGAGAKSAGAGEKSAGGQVQKVQVVGAKSAGGSPYIYNYNNIYNNFFYNENADEPQKKEKEELLFMFFLELGIYQPMEEVMRFWQYHEQTGWRRNGQKIVSKQAAARFWTVAETTKRMGEKAKAILTRLFDVLGHEQRKCICAELKSLTMQSNSIIAEFETEQPIHVLEDDETTLAAFAKIVRSVCGENTQVNYKVTTN